MRPKKHKSNHKWLMLLFMASLLMNAQASVACDMMPGMSEQMAECCCGVSHRSAEATDLVHEQATTERTNVQTERGQTCDDPRINCCMLEVSVGINDPPTSDEGLTLSSAKEGHYKISKQLDVSPAVIAIYSFEIEIVSVNNGMGITSSDPILYRQSPPLYKITERYRI